MSMLDPQDQEPEIADPGQETDIESSDPEAEDSVDIQNTEVSGIIAPAGEPTEDQPDEEPEAESDADKPQWYVVHCYSGYENKVKKNLEHRAESMGMTGHIHDVIVPTEEQIELKDGQRRVVERRIYPGYVLVRMIMDEESWTSSATHPA
jgi:transcriptional antiterminator NusG